MIRPNYVNDKPVVLTFISVFIMAVVRTMSLNCHGFNYGTVAYISKTCVTYNLDILFLQETWLSDIKSHMISDSLPNYFVTHTSAMEQKIASGVLTGRPFGGTAVLVHKKYSKFCHRVFSTNPRVTALRCLFSDSCEVVFCSVYMPYDSSSVDYLVELEDTIGSLQGIIDKYCNCKFVIGGDFNTCRYLRNQGTTVVNSFCNKNSLLWLDHDISVNSYTFHNDSANRYSLIDHFLCSTDLITSHDKVSILIDESNLSDHYAILCDFHVSSCEPIAPLETRHDDAKRPDWRKADVSRYRTVLTDLLAGIMVPTEALLCCKSTCNDHSEDLEYYYAEIVKCMLAASSRSVPSVKIGVQKYWWTPDLEQLKQECIDICHLWNSIGRPRNGSINAERLRRKYRYKIAIKEAAMEADTLFNDQLFTELCSKNHLEFWKTWRKKFCASKCKPTSCLNGRYGDTDILDEFSNFFKSVGQPNTACVDDAFSYEVETLFSKEFSTNNEYVPVDLNDINECICQLKTGKAVSFDGVYNEHIIFGSTSLYVHLCLLFNGLLRHCIVPPDFCVGVIVPLLKNKHGDATKLDMYRGITVSPAISKLFELILLRRYADYLSSDPLQFGFKKNSSCGSALFTFTEVVKHCNKFGSRAHCAFLDVSKAFDKVLHNGLFLKLLKRNVPVSFVKLLKYWYSRLSCMVKWNGSFGQLFPVLCGVRQGGILSPFLFAVYVDELIDNLRNSGFGVYIGNLFVGCVFYADDIVLISVSSFGLQKLLDVCQHYGAVWDMKFNPSKSQITYFGPRSNNNVCKLYLNGSVIDVVDTVKYLGVYFEQYSGYNVISQAFVKFYSQFNNIMAVLGTGKNSNELTVLHLVKAYCLPSLLFGCEIWNLNSQNVHRINVAWNNCFRYIFHGFWRESVKLLQFYCGALPISYLLDQRRLLFWKRMFSSDNIVLCTLSHFVYYRALAVGSLYDFNVFSTSDRAVKDAIWTSFVDSVLPVS